MKIEELYPGFAQKGLELTSGQRFYRIPDEHFDLYGIYYDEKAGRFLRMPQEIADKTNANAASLNGCTAGGRIRFSTDADRISLTVSYDAFNVFNHISALGSSGFILLEEVEEADGSISHRMAAHFIPGHYANVSDTSGPNGFSVEKYLFGGKMRSYILYTPTYNDVRELVLGFPENAKISRGLEYRKIKP